MPRVKTIHKVDERQETAIPLHEVYVNGRLELYEEVQSKGYFSFTLKRDRIVLSAGNHVGVIPLNEFVSLHVEPKIAKENWFYVVSKAQGTLADVSLVSHYVREGLLHKPLIEFLIQIFLKQLAEIDQQGVYRRYTPMTEVTSFPRGRLLFGDSIRSAWSNGAKNSIAVKYYQFSKDVPHNRLLKFSLNLAVEYLSLFPSISALGIRVSDYLNLFQDVPLDRSLGYVTAVADSIKLNAIPESRSYYGAICSTALLLVQNSGLLPSSVDGMPTHSFVVNMETTFEDFCLNILKESQSKFRWNSVHKGADIQYGLFNGYGCDRRNAEPDIIVETSQGTLIIEVKYKSIPNRQDINQAVTYAVAYKVPRVVILCYAETRALSGWQRMGRVGGLVEVWIYRIFLDSPDLTSEESLLASEFDEMSSNPHF